MVMVVIHSPDHGGFHNSFSFRILLTSKCQYFIPFIVKPRNCQVFIAEGLFLPEQYMLCGYYTFCISLHLSRLDLYSFPSANTQMLHLAACCQWLIDREHNFEKIIAAVPKCHID
ncbi:hypothetical protein K7X08_010550 [Anisodus acutangulus]|uniref:Uncharacterized protein n=1 Tax=Anisodus acutangulus TaxID=402998 RepID=A0A9Q1RUJ5_9SOLA|nr:hypothetical protein K7X08_010550 [Anisodus acutangulus]